MRAAESGAPRLRILLVDMFGLCSSRVVVCSGGACNAHNCSPASLAEHRTQAIANCLAVPDLPPFSMAKTTQPQNTCSSGRRCSRHVQLPFSCVMSDSEPAPPVISARVTPHVPKSELCLGP